MIEKAKKEDYKSCIALLRLAMGDIANFISGSEDEEKTTRILQEFFKSNDNRLSYENIIVKKVNNEIVAAACFCDIQKSPELDRPINERLKKIGKKYSLERECFGDGIYIDSIAVDENYRRKGIAKELLKAVCFYAKQNNYKKVALVVDRKKPLTKAYYERFGFMFDKSIDLYGHKYDYMIKNLDKFE